MRIPPGRTSDAAATEAWLAQLEAALDGRSHDPEDRHWRALRDDVRSLAPPLDPELARRLHERATEPARHRRRLRLPRLTLPRLTLPGSLLAPGAALTVALALVAAVLVLAPWRSGRPTATLGPMHSSPGSIDAVPPNGRLTARSAGRREAPAAPTTFGPPNRAKGTETKGPPTASSPPLASPSIEGPREATTSAGAGSAAVTTARKQELAASITLAPEPQAVQKTSERAGLIAVQDGGFVERSNVAVQRAATSEATLSLEIPTAKLTLALAALARLAPVNAENQSLQDITDPYEAASRRLADARAEHKALLKALSQASTEAEIQRLHERLAQVSETISRDSGSLGALAHRADTAEVEVTVVGQNKVLRHHPQTGSGGLTIDGGLHDAVRVLTVACAVLLVTAAVLLPLALTVLALGGAWRAWRRYRREQALQTP